MIESLIYKLISLGITIYGPSEVFCDNKLLVTNTSLPEYLLYNNHNSISYQIIIEVKEVGTMRVA